MAIKVYSKVEMPEGDDYNHITVNDGVSTEDALNAIKPLGDYDGRYYYAFDDTKATAPASNPEGYDSMVHDFDNDEGGAALKKALRQGLHDMKRIEEDRDNKINAVYTPMEQTLLAAQSDADFIAAINTATTEMDAEYAEYGL
jgi:hypothetical protein